ncbi:MAG: hypothetical protein Q4B54_09080, partial [Coriobacteriales bacterium]|nr:hypothetical protein [Coriobacteriales bacterium]
PMKRTGRSSKFLALLGGALILLALAVLISVGTDQFGGSNSSQAINQNPRESQSSSGSGPLAQNADKSVAAQAASGTSAGATSTRATSTTATSTTETPSAATPGAATAVTPSAPRELTYEESLGVRAGYQLVVFEGDYAQFICDLSAALRSRNPHICLENYPELTHNEVYACDYGGFWVEGWTSYDTVVSVPGGNDILFLNIDVEYSALSDAELLSMMSEIDVATEQFLAKVSGPTDVWQQAKVVHDELCASITYDHSQTQPHIRDLYGALVRREAICSGYSSAFMYLMGRLGYSVGNLTSETHAWNYVEAGGADKFVDVAWDDYDLYDAYGRPYIAYDYFFHTFGDMEAAGEHVPAEWTPDLGTEAPALGWNYHVHEGCYMETFDLGAIESAMRAQYESGSNCIYLRFGDDAAFESAMAWLQDSATGVGQSLRSVGYTQPYNRWYDDLVRTVTIGLYAQG